MSPEKQRIAVAEAVGWTNVHRSQKLSVSLFDKLVGRHPNGSVHVPNYLSDLNAMWKVEGTLGTSLKQTSYMENLLFTMNSDPAGDGSWHEQWDVCHATAAQRAEAFLRTVGKWEDEDVVSKCKCGREGSKVPHLCPYARDIHNDNEKTCNCCDDCEKECAEDI